jgi:hypothetical protein
VQVAASVCELVMPYFYSKIICSISKPGFQEAFRQHLVWYGAFALGFAVFAAGRGALFGVINNKLSRALRWVGHVFVSHLGLCVGVLLQGNRQL